MIKTVLRSVAFLAGLLLTLTACGTTPSVTQSALPLATDKPTFVFFYSDN